MLSCTWEGGVPRALLWWVSSSGDIQATSEENSNILVLRSSGNYSGKAFICHAKHPLAKESKQCVLKLGKTWFSRALSVRVLLMDQVVKIMKKFITSLKRDMFNMLWHGNIGNNEKTVDVIISCIAYTIFRCQILNIIKHSC